MANIWDEHWRQVAIGTSIGETYRELLQVLLDDYFYNFSTEEIINAIIEHRLPISEQEQAVKLTVTQGVPMSIQSNPRVRHVVSADGVTRWVVGTDRG